MNKKKVPNKKKKVKPGNAKRKFSVSVSGNPKLNKPEKSKLGKF